MSTGTDELYLTLYHPDLDTTLTRKISAPVLLVNTIRSPATWPLGILTVAECLRKKRIPFLYLDPFARIKFSCGAERIEECTTVMLNSMPPFQKTTRDLCQILSGRRIIVGGNVATLYPAFFKNTGSLLVRGEFEAAAGMEPVWLTPSSPLWSVVEKHLKHYTVLSSWGREVIHTFDRGCPISTCSFCAIKNFPYRKAPDEVFLEACEALSKHVDLIHLGDATTTTDEIPRMMEASRRFGILFSISTTVREVVTGKNTWNELFKTGCVAFLRVGVETFDRESLCRMKKPLTVEEVEEFFEFTSEKEITVVAYVITESSFEKEAEIIHSLCRKYKHVLFSVNVSERPEKFGWNGVEGFAILPTGKTLEFHAFPRISRRKEKLPSLSFREVRKTARVPHFFFLSQLAAHIGKKPA